MPEESNLPICRVCGEYYSRGKCPFCFPEDTFDFWHEETSDLPAGALALIEDIHETTPANDLPSNDEIIAPISTDSIAKEEKTAIFGPYKGRPPKTDSKDSAALIKQTTLDRFLKRDDIPSSDDSSKAEQRETSSQVARPAIESINAISDVDDLSIIRALEEELGKEIPQVSQIEWNMFGFVLDRKKVIGLGLCKQRLVTLPPAVTQLKNLEVLNLRNNLLVSLPESFGNLSNLRELYLWQNQLTAFPFSFGQLVSLQKVDLKSNQLTALPGTFENLKNLEVLLLDNNKLQEFPNAIGKLTCLQILSLASNQLINIGDCIGELGNLRALSLKSNLLTRIPQSFQNFRQLVRLNLDRNRFQKLQESLFQLPALRYLNVEGNPFDYQTAAIIDQYVIEFKNRSKVLSR